MVRAFEFPLVMVYVFQRLTTFEVIQLVMEFQMTMSETFY